MSTLSRRTVTALAIFFSLSATLGMRAPAAADDQDIAQVLRAGGFVIVVRHGATFPEQADTDPLNFDNIAAQRNLNDKGKALAKAFGDALRQVGVPVGKVYTSRYNRAYDTAAIAGFVDIEKTADITEGGLVVSPNVNVSSLELPISRRSARRSPPVTCTVTPEAPTDVSVPRKRYSGLFGGLIDVPWSPTMPAACCSIAARFELRGARTLTVT